MTADGPHSDWTADVIGFLSSNLPTAFDRDGWHHMFSTAYQIGCEALVALGQAQETEWGALPLENPRLPSVLPRWDDVSVSVLWLAEQQNKLEYHYPDGTKPTANSHWTVAFVGAPALPPPNIAAIEGLGPAHATPDVLPVLQSLRLIAEDRWTMAAETVLWRDELTAWGSDIMSDPRFASAVERAIGAMPNDIRAEMDRIATISETDVAAHVLRSAAQYEEELAKHRGPKARVSSPETPKEAQKTLEFLRRDDLDWLFFRRWRLPDGWLSPKEAERALKIFHDPLAIEIRRAVAARLYPDLPFLAD